MPTSGSMPSERPELARPPRSGLSWNAGSRAAKYACAIDCLAVSTSRELLSGRVNGLLERSIWPAQLCMLTTIIYHGDTRTISALLIIAQALFGESRQPLCELVEPADTAVLAPDVGDRKLRRR